MSQGRSRSACLDIIGVMSARPCRDDERTDILAIVNAAAEAYRGVIPADRWREPYMDASGHGGRAALSGTQPVDDLAPTRHACVLPGSQRHGVGGALLRHLRQLTTRRM